MEEIWKDISGYKGYYQVSNLGRVKSLDRVVTYINGKQYTYKSIIIKPTFRHTHNKYIVKLCKNNIVKDFYVARLVAQTFIKPDLQSNDYVSFKDNDTTNCSVNNLYITNVKEVNNRFEKRKKSIKNYYEYNGEIYTVRELTNISGFKKDTIKSRLYRNWNVYESVEIPINLKKGRNC